jgi:cellobiose phosphorylase
MPLPRRHIPGPDPRPGWGHFSADGRSYHVTATDTPRPWMNLISNGTYGAFFSQHGLGFSFFRTPKLCELTRINANESRPRYFDAGRPVYIKDLDSGAWWAGNPQPGEQTLHRGYVCRHSPGWSEISAERNGIRFTFRFFVPLQGTCELWTLTVKNLGRATRRLALVPVVELPVRSTYFGAHGGYDRSLRAIRCFQPSDGMWKRLPADLFFGLDQPVTAWDTSRADFWGPAGDPRQPQALARELANSQADSEWMVAALETRCTLRAGASFTCNGILGYARTTGTPAAALRQYRKRGAIERALREVIACWDRRFASSACELPDADITRFLNVWGKNAMAQVTHGSRARSIGVRDTIQDLRGYLLVEPGYVKPRMLWLLSNIFRSGRSYRAIDPWTGNHDTTDYRDNPVWLAELVNAYVKETGDLAVLDEVVAYCDGGKGTVWEHLVRIVARLMKLRGRHRLVLVGDGDWNDALASFGKEGRGESAWLSVLVVRALRLLAELADASGRTADARRLRAWRRSLADAFNRNAWDGEWYTYGWDDSGVPIGSRRSPEGKIHANVQTWPLMEQIVPAARVPVLWRSIRRYLATDAGLLTCWPAYIRTQPTGARIRDMSPGWCENAAMYCHGTSFYMAACLAAGKGDEAFRALQAYLPTNPRNPKCDMEPFGVTTFYVGPSSRHFGEAGYSWFTGSISWFLFCTWEGTLGIRPGFHGLQIAPCPPRAWERWSVTRTFRGAQYRLQFRKARGAAGRTVRQLVVDGRELAGDTIPAFRSGVHEVRVELA